MDDRRSEDLARLVGGVPGSRRAALRALAGAAGGFALAGGLAPRAAAEFEAGWRRCRKCRGLHLGTRPCPAGGNHQPGDREYALRHGGTPEPGQETTWCWCLSCALLSYGLDGGGACAASATGHSRIGGQYVYHLAYNQRPSSGQEGGWRYCPRCRVLFRPKRRIRGVCAAGGSHQVYPGYRYNIDVVGR
jgi:hypothetical protein